VTRTPGSYKAAFEGIHLLRRSRIPLELKTVILPPNRKELMEFEALNRSFPGMDRPPDYTIALDLRARRDSQSKNRSIKRLRLSPEESLKILSRRRKDYLTEMQAFCAGFMAPAGDRLFPCGAGSGSGCVDAYGNLQPCMLLRHPGTVYLLDGGSLKDAFDRFFPEMRMLKASHPEYLQRCARCFLKGLCEQCPAKSWMEHGALDTPVDYYCGFAHRQAQYLGLIRSGEKAWEVLNWKERIKSFTGSTPR
jgi:radical SAM protein with 4Fe4S-binding SPASM domain